ncbi:endonuclease 8-like 2 [Tachyglossus aculeatus]|uniref:endonuclease 8-like 2 n=1 Tax=Tachyglossus aculeatus TaxID=9261 RepID=UPI0018F4FA85|nr:endonuclease 8-like 2 [Tachyglossus aculeatus]
MPEGPSLRHFHGRVSPFVGYLVVRAGGSSRKLPPALLQARMLQAAQVRLVLHFAQGGFLAFYNCCMVWAARPQARPSTDILSRGFHRGRALEALRQDQPVSFTLLDQRHFAGLGNIIKNEVLYLAGIHPLSPGSALSPTSLEALLDLVLQFSGDWLQAKQQGKRQSYRIYQRRCCPAGHPVTKQSLGPPGGLQRLTWWCPQCQPGIP